MLKKKVSLGLSLNLFRDYSFEESLKLAKEFGFKTIEPGNIDYSFNQIRIEDADDTYVGELKRLITKYEMNVYAFAAHCDMYKEGGFERYLKKYQIAKALGAEIVVGKSSPDIKKSEFCEKMRIMVDIIEKDGTTILFETPGDIDYSYKNASETIVEIDHPNIGINYDTGNFYFRSQGKIVPGKDLDDRIVEKIKYFHLKDFKNKGEEIVYSPIGDGDIDFDYVVDTLYRTSVTHVSLEIPVYLWSSRWESLQLAKTPLDKDTIKYAIERSQNFLLNRYDCFELS